MRASRLIAATVIAFLWLAAALLPFSTPVVALAAVLSLVTAVLAWRDERRHPDSKSERRRESLDAAFRARCAALSQGQLAALQAMQDDCRDALARITGNNSPQARVDPSAPPWVLVLGPPGAGRSAMLEVSGIPFVFATPAHSSHGPRPVRWWLSDRAVFIDTAGALIAHEAGHAEWLALLRTLDDARPTQALGGILVTISADALATSRGEDLDGWADRIRARVDEAQDALGVDVPVHLVVTRCDLFAGFENFYADLRDAERNQGWGFTLPLVDAPVDTPQRVGAELDLLLRALSQRSLRRAGARDALESRERAYQFPLWFVAARPNLKRFVQTLFGSQRPAPSPLARGVWFTSAADARGFSGGHAQSGRGFFVRDPLAAHVIPDAALATRSQAERRRRQLSRALITTPVIAGSLLAMLLTAVSYRGNHTLTTELRDAIEALRSAPTPAPTAPLEALRSRTETLREHVRVGPPRWMRLGLFVGDALAPRASTAFAVFVIRDAVRPELSRARGALIEAASQRTTPLDPARRQRIDDALRAYLLLTTPRGGGEPDPARADEREWLAARLSRAHPRAADDGAAILASCRLFSTILAEDPRLGSPRDLQLVARVRGLLARP